MFVTVVVQYIATCACSKALCQHLESSDETPEGTRGAPHMQRGFAKVTVEMSPTELVAAKDRKETGGPCLWIPVGEIEQAVVLGTETVPHPVIRRPDEQELARQSWNHPQFVEDAARSIGEQLERAIQDKILPARDWVVVVDHEESIHTHNAVAVMNRGVGGGLR